MGALEVFSLPDERFDSIVQCEPAYSVKLDSLSEVAVTPDAHEYFGYKALAKTVSGRLSVPGQYFSAREPYTRITIAAPHEVSEEALDDKVVYARSISGECQFVVAHHQTPDKYKEAGIAVLGSLVRSNNPLDKRSDRRILADMGKKMKKSYLGELDSGQIADYAKMLKPHIMAEVVRMREASFPRDEARELLLHREGVLFSVLYEDGVRQMRVHRSVISYANHRSEQVSRLLFKTFCPEEHTILLDE